MRVGLLIYGSLDTISGGYLYNRQLVDYLHSQGDTVEVVSLPYRGYWAHLGDNVSRKLQTRLATLAVDVLIEDEMNHPSLVWLNRRLPRRYPLVSLVHLLKVTERHSGWIRPIYHQIERSYLRSVDGLIVTSRTTQTEIETRFGVSHPTVVAVPAGDRFPPTNAQPQRPATNTLRLLFVGNVIRRKGLHTVLEAMAAMTASELIVVGPIDVEPDYTQELRRLIERHQLAQRVRFVGPQDGEQLAARYRSADLFVMPAYYESFGIVYLEAMGFGLPTIGTTGGAAHELITHGDNGYLIAPDDATALTQHLQTLHAKPALRHHMGVQAIKRFNSHPSWAASMSKIRSYLITLHTKWNQTL